MNERIKELMIEAFQSHYGDPVTPIAREKAVELVSGWGEKFAELIVRECARVASDRVMDVEGNDWGVRWAIKNHFGVEQ
jgi:hypothetical protein